MAGHEPVDVFTEKVEEANRFMNHKRAIISVNIAVLLFGLAGLFAKWVQLPAIGITFGRVLFSSVALGIFLFVRRQSFRLKSGKDCLLMALAGSVLALHWWAFFQSIQLSTVAIGTITFASFPLFVSVLEPISFHEKLSGKAVVTSVIILIGVGITVPAFSFENRLFAGILVGMISAFAYAVLTLINRKLVGRYNEALTAFYEQSIAAVLLAPLAIAARMQPSLTDLGLLLLLGVETTALAHTLFIASLKALPAHLAGIFSSMETVYGILFAFLLLGTAPTWRECVGAAVILSAVIGSQLFFLDK